MQGNLKNPLKLSPGCQIGLSAINISRPIQQITIEQSGLVGFQLGGGSGRNNGPGELVRYRVNAGNYTRAQLADACTKIFNKCAYPFCSANLQGNSNASLVGYYTNKKAKITGALMNLDKTKHMEIVISTDGNKFNCTRYSQVPIELTNSDLSDFSNLSNGTSATNPPIDGSVLFTPAANALTFSATLNKPQSVGSFSFSFEFDISGNTQPINFILRASNANSTVQWEVKPIALTVSPYLALNFTITIDGKQCSSTSLPIDDKIITEISNISFYRIAGKIGWVLYNTDKISIGPINGFSVDETATVSSNWSQYAFQIQSDLLTLTNDPITFKNIMHTISQLPAELQNARTASNNPIVSSRTNEEKALLQERFAKIAISNAQQLIEQDDMGVFVIDEFAGSAQTQQNETTLDLGDIDEPPGVFVPGDLASQLGFYASGFPVSGQIPKYLFAPDAISTIASDFAPLANGDIQPILIASRTIPLRGAAFNENGESVDVSLLDCIIASYSNGQTFQSVFRPPLYASVANKSEMVVTSLRFDLLDIDGISPFECLEGGSIVLNIRGAN
jgi:hypothetical protein